MHTNPTALLRFTFLHLNSLGQHLRARCWLDHMWISACSQVSILFWEGSWVLSSPAPRGPAGGQGCASSDPELATGAQQESAGDLEAWKLSPTLAGTQHLFLKESLPAECWSSEMFFLLFITLACLLLLLSCPNWYEKRTFWKFSLIGCSSGLGILTRSLIAGGGRWVLNGCEELDPYCWVWQPAPLLGNHTERKGRRVRGGSPEGKAQFSSGAWGLSPQDWLMNLSGSSQ